MSEHTFQDAFLTESRDIVVEGGDITLTKSREENIAQSVAIHAGDTLREILGNPLTGVEISRGIDAVRDALRRDPQLQEVVLIEATEINKATNTVEFRIVLQSDPDFTIEVNL